VAGGPFSERLVTAVAACARALGGSPDADRALDRSEAATLGALRADADRLALRHRHHDPMVAGRWRPVHPHGARLFDALEAARLDAIGVQWLTGVARNLLAHPGRDDAPVRWLAFELVSGHQAPGSKTAATSSLRATLPPALLHDLEGLAADLHDHERFARRSAIWAAAASRVVPEATDVVPDRAARPLPVRMIEEPRRRPSPAAGEEEAEPGDDDREEGSAGGSGTAEPGGPAGGGSPAYHVFTTDHDRVVHAATLVSREELAQLRAELEEELATVRTVVARLAKRLLRVLMARQVRHWQFDLDEGLLDGRRLAGVITSPDRARPFRQEVEARFPATVVTLLIDHSGSMSGRPMRIAALTVEIFARVLERCGVKCEILGFTTREWDGGEPAREWAARGYPEDPGRLNALEHIVIKDADVPWRRARVGLGLFLHDEMLKENIDGEAVAWAHGRLRARTEPRRILVVVSDGAPMDEATLAANGFDYLDAHLVSVVEQIETRSPVQLAAIGIDHDVSGFYGNATTIRSIDELGPALSRTLMTLLGDEDAGRMPRRRRRS
jgi:cobaltochelatase CobT